MGARERVLDRRGAIRRVEDEHGVDVVEEPVVAERDLPAPTLFGRGADDRYPNVETWNVERIRKRVDGMRKDTTTPDTRLADDPLPFNPASAPSA